MKLRVLAITIAFGGMLGTLTTERMANAQPAPPAAAAQPSAQDQAVAENLFSDAKKLMAENKYAEACPKLEESHRLDPAPGTQFNLGDCYEHLGKTASAWALFLNVAAAAKSAGMSDREKIARDRAAALEPKLPKLSIVVPTPTPGMEVKRDGVIVGQAQWGSGVPIDPGKHEITASAPSKTTWTSAADVAAEGTVTVTVPVLTDAPIVPTTTTEPPAEENKGLGTQKTLALVAGGVGVVGVGLGSVFGIIDMGKLSDAEKHCVGNSCDAEGVKLRDSAVSAGNISTIAFTVGLIGLAGGAVLWFTAPSSSSSKASARAHSVARSLILGGTF